MEMNFASNGKANAGLVTGVIGSSLGVLNSIGGNGILGGLFGGGAAACSDNYAVNRYEAAQQARIAELETEIKLRDANAYTDSKILDLYKYFDGELKEIRNALCAQAVHNQKTEDSFVLVRQDVAAVEGRMSDKIKIESERRCCADNAIVNYSNATFYQKMVADVTVGTTSVAQTLYNPLPSCGRECK